ncbi:L,D-transpeptidase [Actinokineospora sp. NBRC 105648]|uniref:L,D-transpeptidase n=1 Tax=Actinokineospora sp. NBRC 105648 TaxID=3032206 RepID=UPI0024A1A987|nr:L,D-transpeptidase [Actinokineospora sp. NBRC 105648]GLZ41390.1 L,D-transpeptidase [Actinokineospora sp. NBRC 105648]
MGTLRKTLGVATIMAAIGTAGVLTAPAASASAAPCGKQARACVSLGANAAWLMRNGAVTYGSVPITSGRPGYLTPPGTFTVTYKDIDHYSQAFNGPMPYSVFFTRSGIAFHEGSLTVKSHGCIHLSHEAAKMFYNNLAPGDVVQVVA